MRLRFNQENQPPPGLVLSLEANDLAHIQHKGDALVRRVHIAQFGFHQFEHP